MTHAPEKREPWHGIAAGEGGDLEYKRTGTPIRAAIWAIAIWASINVRRIQDMAS